MTSHKAHNPAFLRLVNDARSGIRECTVHDVKARLDRGEHLPEGATGGKEFPEGAPGGKKFHFIDVREESEFAADRALGAKHIGRGVLERDIETQIPDLNADIVLYCGGGFRSALAAKNLQAMGYTQVVSMDGGIRAWREAGYPLDK